MLASTYETEAKIEETHWWFTVRRKLLQSILAKYVADKNAAVLDIGTSTGTNLRMLKQLGMPNTTGLDFSQDAIYWCQQKGYNNVHQGDICAIPFAANHFDVVLATDIIEHVDDDHMAMSEIMRVLRPGGIAIVTVPAFASLWGLQDEVSHHKRRYRMQSLTALARQVGFDIEQHFHFNYLLFIPIWLARQLIRIIRPPITSENQLNTPWLNYLLEKIFLLDILTAPHISPPFGVSIFAVLRKSLDNSLSPTTR